ncbi:transporter substrate-binding domain-containing protein, partial [Sulfurimonas sp.]|uniref:transporter substrate-binding domain-containing protein n=1 Tax=Sulfurimonas sp. TaxID=2022749 RepID=UPI003459E242
SEILQGKYPNLNFIDVENIRDGLNRVNKGKLFGYIGTLPSIGHMFQKEFIGELKIAGKFDEFWRLGVGVRNDDKTLFSIFQKAVNSLNTDEKQAILNRWISINYEKGVDYDLINKSVLL